MAIVQRFFSPTAAGAGDGTTWADRAALFTGGAWAVALTGFNFSGTDSLQCMVGPGTYAIGATLDAAKFANPPTAANPLFFCGCDNTGVLLSIPDPTWQSCQPAWDASTLPVLDATGDFYTLQTSHTTAYLLKFTASARNDMVTFTTNLVWCQVINSTNNAAAGGVHFGGAQRVLDSCVVQCTGANYAHLVFVNQQLPITNTRIEGVPGAGGTRFGVNVASVSAGLLHRCTIVNCGGRGISATAASLEIYQSVVANNGATNLHATVTFDAVGLMLTGSGGWGVDGNSSGVRTFVAHNRLRDNASGNITGLGNYPLDLDIYTVDSDDASEYVSAGANGDFSIKNTATIWGMGFGVRDEPAASPPGSGTIAQPVVAIGPAW